MANTMAKSKYQNEFINEKDRFGGEQDRAVGEKISFFNKDDARDFKEKEILAKSNNASKVQKNKKTNDEKIKEMYKDIIDDFKKDKEKYKARIRENKAKIRESETKINEYKQQINEYKQEYLRNSSKIEQSYKMKITNNQEKYLAMKQEYNNDKLGYLQEHKAEEKELLDMYNNNEIDSSEYSARCKQLGNKTAYKFHMLKKEKGKALEELEKNTNIQNDKLYSSMNGRIELLKKDYTFKAMRCNELIEQNKSNISFCKSKIEKYENGYENERKLQNWAMEHHIKCCNQVQEFFNDFYQKETKDIWLNYTKKKKLVDEAMFLSPKKFDKEINSAGYGKVNTKYMLGCYVPTRNKVYIKISDLKMDSSRLLSTMAHEYNHYIAKNGKRSGVKLYKKKDGKIIVYNRQLNEALNELFTKKIMKDKYCEDPNIAYYENVKIIESMEQGFGEELLKRAYYQNDPDCLKEKFEKTIEMAYKNAYGNDTGKDLAKGSWEDFSKALDDSIDSEKSVEEQQIAYNKATWYATIFGLTNKYQGIDYKNIDEGFYEN